MPIAPSNGIELCYETFGDSSAPALLLVMGLGAQMTAWPDDCCRALADAGRFVIRFDNRDAGLSTKLDGVTVDLAAVMAAWAGNGEMPEVPYTLSDMANDAIGLLDYLGIARAHIVGASLGGMIVQTMAIEHGDRVISLTSIMSTTGDPATYQSVPEVRAALLAPRPLDRDGFVAAGVEMSRMMGGRKYFNAERVAQTTGAAYDRSFYALQDGRRYGMQRWVGSNSLMMMTAYPLHSVTLANCGRNCLVRHKSKKQNPAPPKR